MASEEDFDLTGFEDLASILRTGPSDVAPEQPPAELWSRIEAAIANESALEGQMRAGEDAVLAHETVEDDGALANVTPLDSQRRRRARPVAILVGIAAALVLLGVPIGLVLRSSQSDPALTAELAALPEYVGVGSAEVDDGQLRIALEGLPEVEPGARYELWLLDLDTGEPLELHWLGVIDGVDGEFAIPADLDLSDFDTVDISVELDDGDTSHSGLSVLRGELA